MSAFLTPLRLFCCCTPVENHCLEQWFSAMVSRHICVSQIPSGVSPIIIIPTLAFNFLLGGFSYKIVNWAVFYSLDNLKEWPIFFVFQMCFGNQKKVGKH